MVNFTILYYTKNLSGEAGKEKAVFFADGRMFKFSVALSAPGVLQYKSKE